MTRGPLPPHERAWRHPSELPAPQHEPTSRVGHVLIASTAAVSLLLVAWLAISMTPNRSGDADRVGGAADGSAAGSGFPAAGSPAGDPLFSSDDSMLRAVSSLLARNESPQTGPWSSEAATPTTAREVAMPTTGASATSSTAPVTAPVPSDSTDPLVVTVSEASLEVAETASSDVIGEQTDDPAGTDPAATIASSTPLALADTSESSQFAETAPDSSVPADPSEESTTTNSSTTTTTSTSSTSTTSTTTTTDVLPPSAKQLNG